jgi:hypothetical protein
MQAVKNLSEMPFLQFDPFSPKTINKHASKEGISK